MIESEPQSASSMVGRTIAGRYTIRATIGSGGMGFVYRATQAPLEREVALKVLRVDLAHQDGIAERFHREARAASKVVHPNAITIYEFGEDDGIFYLAMELLYGETLRQRLRREPPIEPDNALDIFESMAGALAAAHGEGVVHRDLKPDNIFLAQFKGQGEVVKVLDFGLAKLLDRGADPDGLVTDVNLRLGTPRYMAPEQALGLQPINARCDVYSLGLLLFEMLAGRAPFLGEDGMEVLAQRLRREAPRLSQMVPERNFSEPLQDLVAQMLLREREHRPVDAGEVLGRLRELRKTGQIYREMEWAEPELSSSEMDTPLHMSVPQSPWRQSKALPSYPASTPGIYGGMGPASVLSFTPANPGASHPDSLGMDDFDKPTVVISNRDDFAPPQVASQVTPVQTPADMELAEAVTEYTSGKARTPQPAASPTPTPSSGLRSGPLRPVTAPLFFGRPLVVVLLLVAIGAPLLALLIRWYINRESQVEVISTPPTPGQSLQRPPKEPEKIPPPLVTPVGPPKTPEPGKAPERPKNCTTRIESTPMGAEVHKDGQRVGTTPYVDPLPCGSTAVKYRITAAGYEPAERSVAPDRRRTVNIPLKSVASSTGKPTQPPKGTQQPPSGKPAKPSPGSKDRNKPPALAPVF